MNDVRMKNHNEDGGVDPHLRQRAASNPENSIWVGASAGTGKTKVLTDRVLRLLLPRRDGSPGTPAHRILCLTFTKAAANEMALRVNNILGHWAVMARESLMASIEELTGEVAHEAQIMAAQKLFAETIDSPGGLRIMTIHSFCQSVLGRFPLEAGLAPNFQLMDEVQASALMAQAQRLVLRDAQRDEMAGSGVADAMNLLVHALDEARFTAIMRGICAERHQLANITRKYGDVEGIYRQICAYYKIDPLCAEVSVSVGLDEANLRLAAAALLEDKGKTGPALAPGIIGWLNMDCEGREKNFENYVSIFITTSGEARTSGFPAKAVAEAFPECGRILRSEAQRLIDIIELKNRHTSAQLTRAALIFGQEMIKRYEEMKAARAVLDYDDLILNAIALLRGQASGIGGMEGAAAWVMYKLDGGLDHILVDEAQDTNPEQWGIIEALSNEFFSGYSARDNILRTSFTVGDVKQSIYSFQRAAPEEFQRMQSLFNQKIKAAGLRNENVNLDISFRTTKSVLQVVDRVFQDSHLNNAVGGGEIHHISYRRGQAGLVELWPLFETERKEVRDAWAAPVEVKGQQSASVALAEVVAEKIRVMLDRKEALEPYGRAIEPGDFMILVRSRNAFVEQVVRALKARFIPVSGADRMILGQQLAVQDLIAMAQFCLLPQDDLTLGSVLKSPLLGWDEDELFSLAYKRKGSLWEEICNFDSDKLSDVKSEIRCVSDEKREAARVYLSEYIGRAGVMGAYEFFSRILTQGCPADDFSGLRAIKARLGQDAQDPIEELLLEAQAFSHDHIDHLQLFVAHLEQNEREIKREMEESGGHVRIMTIHGSKGLQAPIVILPDTILSSAAKKPDRMLWPNKTGLDVPFFSPRKNSDPKAYIDIYDVVQALDEQEYYRLLYVAMTRAADRLYVGGYVGSKGAQERSWYFKIKAAMEADENCAILEDGRLRVEHAQEAAPDKMRHERARTNAQLALPEWALQGAPAEPLPPRPLIPSRPSLEDSETAQSPMVSGFESKFKRGNITHKLLQFLPDFDADVRRKAAMNFVQKQASDLAPKVQQSIVDEVLAVLSRPDYAPFFQKGSLAEVPVTGLTADHRIVSGQIDRLVVGKSDIWILDYKTNRPPPRDVKNVPAVYKNQMRAYRDSIMQIYPDRAVHCALLWTDGPSLMILDDVL